MTTQPQTTNNPTNHTKKLKQNILNKIIITETILIIIGAIVIFLFYQSSRRMNEFSDFMLNQTIESSKRIALQETIKTLDQNNLLTIPKQNTQKLLQKIKQDKTPTFDQLLLEITQQQ